MSAIDRILVVGAGAMGSQIAMLGAIGGMTVWLHDVRPEGLAAAESDLHARIRRRVEKEQMTEAEMDAAFARLTFTSDLEVGARSAQLVIEAIVENLDAKLALFAKLEQLTDPSCIFASNSSSIVSSLLGAHSARPGRLCNMHFFNPPLVMKCVEVAADDTVDSDVLPAVMDVGVRMGKKPVQLEREVPGFIANRILSAIVREASILQEGGCASFAAIDEICRTALGHPMGPFELLDMAGLDVNRQMQQLIFDQTGEPADRPVAAVISLVDEGRLGRKSGEGFYNYSTDEGKSA